MPKGTKKKQQDRLYADAVMLFRKDSWAVHHLYSLRDWQHEVADDHNRLAYKDWVLKKIDEDHNIAGPGFPLRLHILAYQIGCIMTNLPGSVWTSHPCDGIEIKFEIRGSSHPAALTVDIWDTVYINGKSCGNRHGGVHQFINLVADKRPNMVYDLHGDRCHVPPKEEP